MFVPEGCLAIDQHNIAPTAGELPILKPIVEQQRIAPELLDRIPAGLNAVLVHEHDHVFEIGREHIGLVARSFGIEEKRFAVRYDTRRCAIFAQQQLVRQALEERRRFRAIAAGKNGHRAALVLQFARELFDDRSLAGAADGEIADRDHLHPDRVIPQQTHVI